MNEKETTKELLERIAKLQSEARKSLEKSECNGQSLESRGGSHGKQGVDNPNTRSNKSRNQTPERFRRSVGGSQSQKVGNRIVQLRREERNKLNTQRTRGPSVSNSVSLKKNNKLTQQLIKNGISQNFVFDTPMPRMDYTIEAMGNSINKLRVRGTEYLTTLSVKTTVTGNPLFTQSGDVVYHVPLNPHFFQGLRFVEMVPLYTKHEYRSLVMEYVPIVPSTQNGTLVFFFSHDINENFTLSMSSDERLRRALAHSQAIDANVYNHVRAIFVDDKQIDGYYNNMEGEPRFENQGAFYAVAGTSFSPSMLAPESVDLDLGHILVHYDLILEEPNMQNELGSVQSGSLSIDGALFSAWWAGNTDPNVPFGWIVTALNLAMGVSINQTNLLIVIPEITLLCGTGTATVPLLVDTPNVPVAGVDFLSKGSIWYGRVDYENVQFMQWFDTLSAALSDQPGAHVQISHPNTDVFSVNFRWWLYDTRIFA
jgi:hypothetical protein